MKKIASLFMGSILCLLLPVETGPRFIDMNTPINALK